MDLTLIRSEYLSTGIFGVIDSDDGSFTLTTLEHAFPVVPDAASASTTYAPIIPNGTYTCVRGKHTLEHHPVPFEAFEITGVPNHTKCLLHIGNFNRDSEGCVLVGLGRDDNNAITQSTAGFDLLMFKQIGVNEFKITIS